MFPDRSHLCMPLGRSLACTATIAAAAAGLPMRPNGPHAPTTSNRKVAIRTLGMRPTLRDELWTTSALEEDRPASRQQQLQRALDPLSHMLGELEHKPCIVGRVSTEMRNVDRLAECDETFRKQRKQNRKGKKRKRRRDRRRRPPEQSRERPDLEHHRVHLF